MKRIPMMPFIGLLACICLVLSACQKEYSIETSANLAAKGSLKDTTTGDCLPETITGTYYGGVEPGRDTAYVSVNVMVTSPGTYTIYTDTEDGFYFSDSGYFATTGLNVIKLKPVGTPIIPGTYDFSVTFDTSICGFTLVVQDSTGTGLGGGGTTNPNEDDHAWQFTGPQGTYNGPIEEATEGDTTISSIPFHYLYLFCPNSTGDSALQVIINFPGGAIAPGTYNTATTSVFNFQDGIAGEVIYSADPTAATPSVTYTITSYDASTHIVSGTFNGQAKDKDGNSVNITAGAFTAKTQ